MDEWDRFPCGANLAKHRHKDNTRGSLNIPLPFPTEDVLTLEWERIQGFDNYDEDFLYKWGRMLAGDVQRNHYLGQFFYCGEEMQRTPLPRHSAERFGETRLDKNGSDEMGSRHTFEGEHGFDVWPLLMHLPEQGHFETTTPSKTLLNLEFGWRHSAKIDWFGKGGARWNLDVRFREGSYDQHGEILYVESWTYRFDFHEQICNFDYFYSPEDKWRNKYASR